jgi:hypothetical protein
VVDDLSCRGVVHLDRAPVPRLDPLAVDQHSLGLLQKAAAGDAASAAVATSSLFRLGMLGSAT